MAAAELAMRHWPASKPDREFDAEANLLFSNEHINERAVSG